MTFPPTTASPVVLLLIGLPASGKSSLAEFIHDSATFHQIFSKISVIDTDAIRKQLFGHNFLPKNEVTVVAQKKKIITQALKKLIRTHNLEESGEQLQRPLVIIDDMHYYISMRHEYYELAQEMQALYISVYLNVPLKKCIEWNEKRGSPIPISVLTNVAHKFDVPGKKYHWDRPHISVTPHIHSVETIGQQILQQITDELVRANAKAKRKQRQENSTNTSSTLNAMHKKSQLTRASLEKATRNLFGMILAGKETFPHQDLIVQLLSTNFNLRRTAPHFATRVSALRKQFLEWLLNYSKTEVSIDNLILFLRKEL